MIFKKNAIPCLRLALAALLAVPLAGCLTPDPELPAGPPAPLVTCNDEATGITVDYPSDWLLDNSPAGGTPQIQIQTQNGVACVTIQVLPDPIPDTMFDLLTDDDIVKYAQDNWAVYRQDIETIGIIDYPPNIYTITIDGKKFVAYCLNYKSRKDKHIWFVNKIIGLYNDKIYVFKSAFDTSTKLNVRLAIIKIYNSIRFEADTSHH